ncbi:uncharacterized protein LOC111110998 [Crassostrea virginica]
MDRRLLLNDPNTLLSHIETLQREMASLTTKVNMLNTKVTTCNTEVTKLNTEVVTLNTEVTKLNTEVTTCNTEVTKLNTEVTKINTEVTKLNTEVTSQQAKINKLENQLSQKNQEGTGSVYTVWGRKSCPAVNGTTTVYTGITAGKSYNETGSGVNTLCLPHNPDEAPLYFSTRVDAAGGYVSYLYGSEYQFTYQKFAQDDDVPCAVCHVTIATSSLMIPAKTTCPSEWTMQYNGYLVSDYFNYKAFDYICLHNDAEYMTEGARRHNDNGHILYPVQAICGSLPCPPYKDGQYITCVVCSL